MNITERKYFDIYLKGTGKEIPSLIANYDLPEDKGDDYLTKVSAVF